MNELGLLEWTIKNNHIIGFLPDTKEKVIAVIEEIEDFGDHYIICTVNNCFRCNKSDQL